MVNIHLLMKRKGAIAEFFFEPIDQQVKYIKTYHSSMHYYSNHSKKACKMSLKVPVSL